MTTGRSKQAFIPTMQFLHQQSYITFQMFQMPRGVKLVKYWHFIESQFH